MKIDFNTILFKHWLKEGWRISDTSNVVLLEIHIKFLAISEIQQIKSSNKRFSLIRVIFRIKLLLLFSLGMIFLRSINT